MLIHERKRVIEFNWTAILSYAGSLVVCVAIWAGVIRAVEHLVK
jgi:hypothetical protein